MNMEEKLPIGTKIYFIKDLWENAGGDHPFFLFAKKDETGIITGHNSKEGYMVKTDQWKYSFGSKLNEEFLPIDPK